MICKRFKAVIKHFCVLLMASLFVQVAFSQIDFNFHLPDSNVRKTNFKELNDEILKKEIGLFTITGGGRSKTDSLAALLTPVKLRKCADSFLYFEKGNLYALSLLIDVTSKKTPTGTAIDEIRYVFYKPMVLLPASAFADLPDPVFCTSYSRKGKSVACNAKAFWSVDKRRVYIYMLNGKGAGRYEVTWVLTDRKYVTRVVDAVPEL
jgi:hypothetical protein